MKTAKPKIYILMCVVALLMLLAIVRVSLISTLILYYLTTNTIIL